MTDVTETPSVSDALGECLPYLRRYARALTGSQNSGDAFAAASLEAILTDRSVLDGVDTRTGVFRVLYGIWASAGAPVEEGESGPRAKAQKHLAKLTNHSREALLLHTIEGFSFKEVGQIIGVEEGEASELVQIARREMADSVTGSVMIIEDEAIIAMDIETIVRDLGHEVTAIAVTREDAVREAMAERPGLVLADIQLADDSSGIDAVKDILSEISVPVIFITAFPERLLTGDRPEPTYLVTKPFQEATVRAAISQALFFNASHENASA